jgi:PAS domain S-box-containing protein
LLGYEPGALAGRRIADLVPPVARPGKARDLAGLASGEQRHYDAERRYRCRDGGYLPVFVSYGLIRDAQGDPVRLAAIVVDDSDRAAAREALLRSQRMLAASQQQAQLGSYEADLRRDEVTCSPELLRMAGLRADASGTLRMDEFVKAVAPGEQDLLRQRWSADATARLAEENEFRLLLPDGTERLVRHWSEVQLDSTGQPQGVLGTVQDITETRRAARDVR